MDQFDIETSCGRVRVYRRGGGSEKLVLLHGEGCDSAMLSWRGVMERLYYDAYTAYAVDLPGYGASERPENMAGTEFYQKHARALGEVCDALELHDFVLAGRSMGAAIAVRFALDEPDRVKCLMLADPWGVAERLPRHWIIYHFLKKKKRIRKWYGRVAGSRMAARRMIRTELIGDKSKITAGLIDEARDICGGENEYLAMYDFASCSITRRSCAPYYGGDWDRLPMRVVFVRGKRDRLVRADDAHRAAGAVPMGTYRELEGCRHWTVRERPEEFVRILTEEAAGGPAEAEPAAGGSAEGE